jgi:SAM-dependent methyltransferase
MSLIDTIGWKVTGLRNRISDVLWERRLNIETGGQRPVDHPDANRYGTMAHRPIIQLLDALKLRPDDVLVDIGCGKGRIICHAARRRLKRVIGVDIDRELCEDARVNVDRMKGRRTPIDIINLPAQEFDYRDATVCTLFNSFGEATLVKVLDSIERSLRENPRELRFAYINPFYEHLLQQSKTFQADGRMERHPWAGLKFTVSFWRSQPL